MDDSVDVARTSFFQPLGYQSNNCGYCKRKHSSPSYYIQSSRVRHDHYQELIDRGWRRSGRIYYKPDLPRSCCPHYTIRLPASEFKPRKDQRKAVNRWNEFVLGQEYIRRAAYLAPKTKEEKRQRKTVFDVANEIHRAEYSNVKRPIDPKTKRPIEPAHRFEVTLESDSFSESKWRLFQRYQQAVHKEPKSKNTKRTFERFLCSGLRRTTETTNGKSKKLGSYHQCYRLDGKLIAIAVLDLLPHVVSAVYILYDPEFEPYELGKVSALREISLALEQDHNYYYMGYYIHSCVKMKYKANFRPQQILDPESLEWGPLDSAMLGHLDKAAYYSSSRAAKAPLLEAQPDIAQAANTATFKDQLALDQEEVRQQAEEVPNEANNDSLNGVIKASKKEEIQDGEDCDDDSDPVIPEGSLFDLQIPGIMTKEEVKSQVDLSQWKLMVQGQIIEFEDLRGWEEWSLDDPQSLKGIAAELAAAIGPNIVKESVMMLFE